MRCSLRNTSRSVSGSSSSGGGGRKLSAPASVVGARPRAAARGAWRACFWQKRAPAAAPPAATVTEEPRVSGGAAASSSSSSGGGSGSGGGVSPAVAMSPVGNTAPRAPYKRPKVSLFDALKFNGPAPEIVNGRLAMVGLLAAARAEADTGLTAAQLLEAGLRSPATLAAAAAIVAASMAPILKGARHEAFGAFSPRAEFLNGRAAMVGWAALLALEHKAGVPFF